MIQKIKGKQQKSRLDEGNVMRNDHAPFWFVSAIQDEEVLRENVVSCTNPNEEMEFFHAAPNEIFVAKKAKLTIYK
jgi:hypothetical protein